MTCISEPSVRIIADSQHKEDRLTTFELKYWRPILPEVNTHRMLSKNAASSRAMSFSKRCDLVRDTPFVPAHWNSDQKGMIGGEEFSDSIKEIINADIQKLASATANYLEELNSKIERLTGKGIHKQYLNRYLEPFISTTQLISGTEWNNFFKLRCASDAQPEFRDIALKMKDLLESNKPVECKDGYWHLPYVTAEELKEYGLDTAKKISVARCARVSYRAYTGDTKLEVDLALYDRLLKGGHMSPFEHVAVCDSFACMTGNQANYVGWTQLRKLIEADMF